MTYLIPHIGVLNQSNGACTDEEVDQMVAAVQHQVTYQFRPWWGTNASIQRYADQSQIPVAQDVWTCLILDKSDVDGAGGYHEESTGVPDLKVFAGDLKKYGASISVAFSHEVLETLGDPLCNQSVQVGRDTFWSMEACDACEDDQYAYEVIIADGTSVLVSDFVTKQWFNPSDPPPYDYKRHIDSPLQLLTGGYIGEWSGKTQRWTQRMADQHAKPSHRIARRNARLGDGNPDKTVYPESVIAQYA